VAAAIAGHADAIVTFNIKHFPVDVLLSHGTEVQHPDDFVIEPTAVVRTGGNHCHQEDEGALEESATVSGRSDRRA